jgi:hypothetical protein
MYVQILLFDSKIRFQLYRSNVTFQISRILLSSMWLINEYLPRHAETLWLTKSLSWVLNLESIRPLLRCWLIDTQIHPKSFYNLEVLNIETRFLGLRLFSNHSKTYVVDSKLINIHLYTGACIPYRQCLLFKHDNTF